ncbi:hypothetical protein [Rhizobium ruizarguesonis]|jgi:hypothetical protein|uniref:hypothetical protein n=1 Tax=Rhizobium ruizarguesonis TaxID=2081791 RepID=UPI00102F57EF|nr:hypothetical protein [Rhizobium ruizarguesonis]TBA24721.1 hypothetical protein ELH61_02415 [Rhizobium ruizarguesonis]
MTTGSPTALISTDLALGWQSGMDLSCSIEPISASGDIARTWNGRAVNLAMPEFRLFSVRISSGQGEVRSPALSQLWPGTVFALVPTNELGDALAVGTQSRTLVRDPHPGSVRCVDAAFEPVEFSVVGRVVTLSAPATTPVRIYYRPVLTLMVIAPWQESFREAAAEVSWSLECEELGGEA